MINEPTVCPTCDGMELIEKFYISWNGFIVHGLKCLACGEELLWLEVIE